MTPLEKFLDRLRARGPGYEPRPTNKGWEARCPAHEDTDPSLDIDEAPDRKLLVRCFTGCTYGQIMAAVGLKESDGFPSEDGAARGRSARTAVTLAELAIAKTLDIAFLRQLGVHDLPGGRGVGIPYHDADAKVVATKTRTALKAKDGSFWERGKPVMAYGIEKLAMARENGYLILVEGETDCWALWFAGFPALGIPGASNVKTIEREHVAGIERVYISHEPDKGGDTFVAGVASRLAAIGWNGDLREFRLEGAKDPCEFRQQDAATFRERFRIALASVAKPIVAKAPQMSLFVPFPVEVLPEPLRTYVASGSRAIGCDPSYLALPLLASLASVIGTSCQIELKPEWREFPILWAAIIGDSGTMKTPAFKLAMAPIRKLQDMAFKEHEAERVKWDLEQARYEAQLTAYRKKATTTADLSDPPERPVSPIARRLVVQDTTVEAMAPILRDNPRGVLVARDELSGFIAGFGVYGVGKARADVAHWLSMHSGDSVTIDRRRGDPPTIYIPTAAVSITGGIQPEILRRVLGQEYYENGLAARLLLAAPTPPRKRWTEAAMDPEVQMQLQRVLGILFGLEAETFDDGGRRPRIIRLSADARRVWVEFYNTHAIEQEEMETSNLKAAWSKLEGYAARLGLVVHLTRWAAGDPACRDVGQVDESSIAAGIALSRWFGNEARRVYAMLAESPQQRELRQLVAWIAGRGGSTTVRDLMRGPRPYRDDQERAERGLAALVTAGVGYWDPGAAGSTGGRPTLRFRLNSPGDGDETHLNHEESGGCVAVATSAGCTAPDPASTEGIARPHQSAATEDAVRPEPARDFGAELRRRFLHDLGYVT